MLLLLAGSVAGQRQWQLFNDNWEYLESSAEAPAAMSDQKGKTVNLPHTWNQWDATDMLPGYRRDISWYTKHLTLDTLPSGKSWLYLEGANTKAHVFINDEKAGSHIGGYLGFWVEITPWLRTGKNTIRIRVDNQYDPALIPSQKSDFFIYGGLTRDVWLVHTHHNYLSKLMVSTPEVSELSASTEVEVQLNSYSPKSKSGFLQLLLSDGENVISKVRESVPSRAGNHTIELALPEIPSPKLWSPDDPHLYELEVQYWEGNKQVDAVSTKVGYRWFRFGPDDSFYLNGKRLLLRGTHRHEEHAGYGAAMPNELHRKDIVSIKEMGANFIRLAHYPQDPEIYKACNELGLIVWDELPWCRGGIGDEEWKENTRRLLKEQIVQNYNHPSVFFWSLGNEIYWLPDFPGGGDTATISSFLKELNSLAHQLDPLRMTAVRKYYAGAHIVDVFSPSIWSGWYAGVYTNYEETLKKQRLKYPRFLHMEYGGSSHVGRHTETPITGSGLLNADEWEEVANQVNIKNIAKEGDWTENYIVDLFDWHLSVSETSDWFAGNAQWAFKDFGTPLRPENAIPYLNQKGLADRSGKPKDAYYVFKSYWSDVPFAYIESHSWTERNGPEGKARQVCVFSNCEKVSLSLNGQSLGQRQRIIGNFPANNLRWEVPFSEGANTLIATGYKEGKKVAEDSLTIRYSYERYTSPDQIVLKSSQLDNGNLLIEATMVDNNARRVLDYEKRIYFSADGESTLLINGGTPTTSQVIEMANGKACIELIPQAGRTIIEARNQDFKGSYLVLDLTDEDIMQFRKIQKKTQNSNHEYEK
jgi:beta-galactosidase